MVVAVVGKLVVEVVVVVATAAEGSFFTPAATSQ